MANVELYKASEDPKVIRVAFSDPIPGYGRRIWVYSQIWDQFWNLPDEFREMDQIFKNLSMRKGYDKTDKGLRSWEFDKDCSKLMLATILGYLFHDSEFTLSFLT